MIVKKDQKQSPFDFSPHYFRSHTKKEPVNCPDGFFFDAKFSIKAKNGVNAMKEEEKINRIAAEAIEAAEKVQPEELPRLDNGMIDVETLSGGKKDEKGRYIIPAEVIEGYSKELPNGCITEDGQKWTANGGVLCMPNTEIRRKGAEALHATQRQRRTFKEAIDIMLRSDASTQNIRELGLKEGASNLDVIIAAGLKQAARGNVKAMDFLRDTVGEKPVEQLNADISGLSEEDKQMLENIKKRLESD